MDVSVIAYTIVLIACILAVILLTPYIAHRLKIDVAIVYIIGILFWPAWLVMLLVAAGKVDESNPLSVESNTPVESYTPMPAASPSPKLSSLSASALARPSKKLA